MNLPRIYRKLDPSFYQSEDVVMLAKLLLGKLLVTRFDGELTSGIIVETEAYRGAVDKASHAYGNRRTGRTEIMFASGGLA
jgi:DNA-3-methyladenine glycosylase